MEPAGETTEGAQVNGKLEETAEVDEVSDDSSDDWQDIIYSVGLSSCGPYNACQMMSVDDITRCYSGICRSVASMRASM